MKRKSWSRTGVSDIIANILILAITVVLFSSIIMFVSSMPAPQPNTYGDFTYTLDYKANEYANISMKHVGGPSLPNATTRIYFMTNSSQIVTYISDSDPSIGNDWNLGTIWSYNITGANLTNLAISDKLDVMIVDIGRNMVVWTGKVLDNTASSVPVILDRYLAENVGSNIWIRANTFEFGQPAALFVNVYDGGNDIRYVNADLSSLRAGATNFTLSDNNKDGWWSGSFPINVDKAGTKTINITAVDWSDRWTKGTLTVKLISNGSAPVGPGGGSGEFPANFMMSQLQGMNIFRKTDWDNYNYTAVATRHFQHSEQAVVVVASKFMVNYDNLNVMNIIDVSTRNIIYSVSSPTYAFKHYDYYSGYYIYEATIDIPKLSDDRAYMVQVQLRDSWFPDNNVFYGSDTFYVGNVTYPTILTYSDSDYENPSTNFTTFDTIYVKITNNYGGDWIKSAGLVQITDYFWKTQVNRIPGLSPYPNPVDNVTRQESPNNEYRFSINLNYSNQDPWNPGLSSYMLRYDMFQTDSEKYLLATMVNITSPKITLDLVEGQNGPNTGWSQGSLINFYQNNNQWVPPDFINNYPGKHAETFASCNFVRLGDMNNNGRNDVIAVLDGFHIIKYSNNGMWTPSPIYDEVSDSRGTVAAIQLGYINDDNLPDIVVAYVNKQGKTTVGYYRNDGVWSFVYVANITAQKATSIQAIDVGRTVDQQGLPHSMSIAVGFSSGGAKIFTNTDGLGNPTSWDPTDLPGGTPIYSNYPATGEQSLNSSYGHGTFASANSKTGANYELLREIGENVTSSSTASSLDTTSTSKPIFPGVTEVTGWNNWNNGVPIPTFYSVTVKVSYSSINSQTPGYITFNGYNWTIVPGTTGVLTEDLTSDVTSLAALQALTFRVSFDAGINEVIEIKSWTLEIRYTSAHYIFDHVFMFGNIPQAVMNTFEIYANSTATTGHDTYLVQYKINNGTWTDMSNLIIDATSTTAYSGIIGATPAGTNTIYVRIHDVNRTSIVKDSLYVRYIGIVSTSIQSNPIGEVTAVKVADMDGDKWPDIVVSDKSGIWVYWNKYGVFQPAIFKNIQTGLTSILSIGPGTFHGKNGYMDIAVGTSSGIYLITQSPLGTYSTPKLIASLIVNSGDCMAVGDVFGNGYYSIVVGSGSSLRMYVNHGTNFSPQTIDTLANKQLIINTVSLGMLRNG